MQTSTQAQARLTSDLSAELDAIRNEKTLNDGLNWKKWVYSENQEYPNLYGDPIIKVFCTNGLFWQDRLSWFIKGAGNTFKPGYGGWLVREYAVVYPEKYNIEEKRDFLINYNFIREVFGVWYWGNGEIQPKFEAKNLEDAINTTWKLYERAEAKGKLKSLSERDAEANSILLERLKRKYGNFSKETILEMIEKLNNSIKHMQKTGENEFSSNGYRRTSAAVSSEGARDAGQEKMHLQIYLQYLDGI